MAEPVSWSAVGAAIGTAAASSIATSAISQTRRWIKEQIDQSIANNVSQNSMPSNNMDTSSVERSVAAKTITSNLLVTDLDEIKDGIDTLRDRDYEVARRRFIEAFRWRNTKPDYFKETIKDTFRLCDGAPSTISNSTDRIHVYSLLIVSGLMFHSDFGANYYFALRHIYHVLDDMNRDTKLRQSMMSALGARFWWKDNEKEFLRAVVRFSVTTKKLIDEIQEHLRSFSEGEEDEKHSDVILLRNIVLANANGDELSLQRLLRDDWIPRFDSCHCFGKIGLNAFKHSIIKGYDFRKFMNISDSDDSVMIEGIQTMVPAIIFSICISGSISISNFAEMRIDFDGEVSIKKIKNQIKSQVMDDCLRIIAKYRGILIEISNTRYRGIVIGDDSQTISDLHILPNTMLQATVFVCSAFESL